MTKEYLIAQLNKTDDTPQAQQLVKEANEYIKESLYKVSNKFFDKHTGNFNTAYERPLNRIVTGLIPVAFLANDAYNLSVMCGDKKEKNHGMGLYFVKKEIEKAKGKIVLEEDSEYTTFKITIPQRRIEAVVIEDEPVLRQILVTILKKAGFLVTGFQRIEQIDYQNVDALYLDIMLWNKNSLSTFSLYDIFFYLSIFFFKNLYNQLKFDSKI